MQILSIKSFHLYIFSFSLFYYFYINNAKVTFLFKFKDGSQNIVIRNKYNTKMQSKVVYKITRVYRSKK